MQLFLTVGSQMPFDRLSSAMARWARQRPQVSVFAQVGHTRLKPGDLDGMAWRPLLEPSDYLARSREADILVAHAGMGSVLTVMELKRPLVVMPRRGHLAETRNDHQVDTAEHLKQRIAADAIFVADDEHSLPAVLDRACWPLTQTDAMHLELPRSHGLLQGAPGLSRADLIGHLRGIIEARR